MFLVPVKKHKQNLILRLPCNWEYFWDDPFHSKNQCWIIKVSHLFALLTLFLIIQHAQNYNRHQLEENYLLKKWWKQKMEIITS